MNPDTILKLIAESGYTLEELKALEEGNSACPTVADYLPKVKAATGAAADTYGTYWAQLAARYGERPLNTIKVSELQEAALAAAKTARRRSNSTDGRGAEENFVAASRRFFELAVKDGHITRNPAKEVVKRKRHKSSRRALTGDELSELWESIDVGSDDPELDRLLVRFHFETGARREGALNLKVKDLDFERQTVRLDEKYGKRREQPVSYTLLKALDVHARRRGYGRPDSPVFHYKGRWNGEPHPLTRKRYNSTFPRLQEQLPWAARIGSAPTSSATPPSPWLSGTPVTKSPGRSPGTKRLRPPPPIPRRPSKRLPPLSSI